MDDDLRALHNNSDPDTLARLRQTYDREYAVVAIKDAYLQMADHAHYRPEAPTDGMGNIPYDVDPPRARNF
jgi:hypothetical protein